MEAEPCILGKDESNLYLANQPEGNDDVAVADFASLFEARLQQVRDELTQELEGRLRDEHETMKAAAQRQMTEAEQQHRAEVEQIHHPGQGGRENAVVGEHADMVHRR